MALRACPECDKSVSTDATTCPHCGFPLRSRKKRRSLLGPLLLIFFVVAALAIALDAQTKKFSDGFYSTANTVPIARCNASQADALMGKFISAGVLLKLESNRQVPRIYVLEAWHQLTIDEKRTFDNAIQCHLMRGLGAPKLAVYHDGRTGKEVAETGPYGFSVK